RMGRGPGRALGEVFAATLNVTLFMPVPVAPPVTVIQPALLTAVHEQLVPVTTETLPAVVPVDATAAPVAAKLYVQLFPDCVTVYPMPAIVMVPTRDDPVVFAATL